MYIFNNCRNTSLQSVKNIHYCIYNLYILSTVHLYHQLTLLKSKPLNEPYDFYFPNKLVQYSMAQAKDDSDDLTRVVEAHKTDNQRPLNTSLLLFFLLKSECSTKDHYRETLKGPWVIENSWFVNRLHHYINFQKPYPSQGQIAY